MIQDLETIKENLATFDALSPCPLRPFWDLPEFGDDPFWGPAQRTAGEPGKLLVISGPARHGNHLLHSMLDDHPQLPRSPGEDSFLAAFFEDLRKNVDEARRRLTGPDNVAYMLELSGFGTNKWKTRYEMAGDGSLQNTPIWAGIQQGHATSVADYQDTVVFVDYPAFESRLHENANVIRKSPTYLDALWQYFDAFARLDPEGRMGRFTYLYVGSGMRAEMKFILDRSDRAWCLTPVRPFESFYHSFASGRRGSNVESENLVQEAWEHWRHKIVDYLLLLRTFPSRVCLVCYDHLVKEPMASGRQLCRFLDVDYDCSCLTPTSLGRPTKGNSSFPKDERDRGRIYRSSLDRVLPVINWPQGYAALWRMVAQFAV